MPEEHPGAADAALLLLDTQQVAELLGVHTESVNRMRRRGEIPAYYLGHRMLRFHRDDVMKWLEKFRYQTPPPSRKRQAKETAADC